jgi:phosphohistidine phosphatase
MKILYLVRHAKSSWADPGQPDFDRPLNERGKKDAPQMGKRLNKKKILPDLLLSSPARRALATCKKIARELGYDEARIQTNRRLYHADSETLLDVIQQLNDSVKEAMLFGHNPGLTDFVNKVMHANLANLPTCGVVAARFITQNWANADSTTCELLFVDFPKNPQD